MGRLRLRWLLLDWEWECWVSHFYHSAYMLINDMTSSIDFEVTNYVYCVGESTNTEYVRTEKLVYLLVTIATISIIFIKL